MPENTPREPIYYTAVHRHGVDDKRRVQIPAKWRSPDGEEQLTLILWPKGTMQEACLLVLPRDLWSSLMAKVTAMGFADPNAEALRRSLGRKSDRVALDKGGRICLPDAMAKAAGIEKEAVLVGLLDRFEIWNPQRYELACAVDEELSVEAFKKI